jgi:hypothetical protein
LDLAPLFLEICRLKVVILYEKFTKNLNISKPFVFFAYFEARNFKK